MADALEAPADARMAAAGTRVLTVGVLTTLAGLWALVAPEAASLALVLLVGALLIVGGAFQLVIGLSPPRRVELVVLALIYMGAGAVTLAHPFAGLLSLTLLAAFVLAATGAMRLSAAVSAPLLVGRGWMAFAGVAAIALASLLVAWMPSSATWALGLIVGVDLIVTGLLLVAFGRRVRHRSPAEQ